ncbi:hypothetical protein [Levilactobacillus brevis]|nr:hypothetical protein [Levilactobacillus brevis]
MTHEQIEYRNCMMQGMASYGGDVALNHAVYERGLELEKQSQNI